MHHQRPLELRGDVGFIGRAEIVAVLELALQLALGVALVQHGDGVVIADARKRRVDFFERGEVASHGFQIGATALQACA